MINNIKEFFIWEMSSQDTIDVKKIYIDVCNDLTTGILLSQIIYWHLPSKKDNKSKLRVIKQGNYWLAKSRQEWYDEIRISPKQFDRCIKILEKLRIVDTKLYRFNNAPTKHIKVNFDVFFELLSKQLEAIGFKIDMAMYSPILPDGEKPTESAISTKGKNGFYPKVKNDFTQRSKSLTEITNKDYNNNNKPSQMTNFKQRDYDEDDLESLYTNL